MIRIQNMSFGYNKGTTLFSGLSLRIPDGGIYGLLGKNGAGKTSLLKVLAGLVFPRSGETLVFEQEPRNRRPDFLSDLYLLPEDLYVPPLTAKEYCECYAPFYPAFDHAIFNDVTKQFDIAEGKRLTEMSHGQKKKFLIAFGIATQARLFIMDEPTNGLDIPSKTLFRQLLAKHFSEKRIFIISTHQVYDIENLIDHIILLDNGKIIFNQTTHAVSRGLIFSRQSAEPNTHECLYSEKQLGGYIVIKENLGGQESEIDLEVLFNALLTNTHAFNKIFG